MQNAVRAADVIKVLERNDEVGDRAICKALVHLYNRQIPAEQAVEATLIHNNRGFRANDAKMGTSMAQQFLRKGTLTPKQINYWRVKNRRGKSRIAVYWRQLLEEAWKKQAKNA